MNKLPKPPCLIIPFNNFQLAPKATYVECFCSLLEPRIMLKENEKDFIVMQHKFRIQGKDGKTKTVKSNFLKIGEKNKTAMSVCVGYTAATTAQVSIPLVKILCF